MTLYVDTSDGLVWVGTVAACSAHDLLGESYVHVFDEHRDEFSLPHEPYDWFFDTYKEALDWADDKLGGVMVGY